MSVLAIVITIVFIYFVIMVPLQYSYIKELKKAQASHSSQQDLYDTSSPSTQLTHYQIQSNIFFVPANAVASLIYRIQHGKDTQP